MIDSSTTFFGLLLLTMACFASIGASIGYLVARNLKYAVCFFAIAVSAASTLVSLLIHLDLL